MNHEMSCREVATSAINMVKGSHGPDSGSANGGDESPICGFNHYIYENLLNNIEGQVEYWNRKAVREPNPEAAHALWLKAEGLGYALRLLYAFEPEFRELVECANRAATNGTIQQ